ncbi:hypothetical protein J6590_021185 [Homalodisca vitripennis]|nr:hypothetical protein J6590_021185 [Homalodisca vitripennis]
MFRFPPLCHHLNFCFLNLHITLRDGTNLCNSTELYQPCDDGATRRQHHLMNLSIARTRTASNGPTRACRDGAINKTMTSPFEKSSRRCQHCSGWHDECPGVTLDLSTAHLSLVLGSLITGLVSICESSECLIRELDRVMDDPTCTTYLGASSAARDYSLSGISFVIHCPSGCELAQARIAAAARTKYRRCISHLVSTEDHRLIRYQHRDRISEHTPEMARDSVGIWRFLDYS